MLGRRMHLAIRPFRDSDLAALYTICLQTADHGADATSRFRDPALPGSFYAAPYARLEPELCFVLAGDDTVLGYVLGTADTAGFAARCEREWFPGLRARLPLPASDDRSADAALLRLIHAGLSTPSFAREYPAHLHIDLLPAAQGQGWGRRLLDRFFSALRDRGVPAVHLGVSEHNQRAIHFYEAVGFHLIEAYPLWRAYGRKLLQPAGPDAACPASGQERPRRAVAGGGRNPG